MIRITQPLQGQVLNRLQGRPTADGLVIDLAGRVDGQAIVTVNGQPTPTALGEFATTVTLRPGHNRLEAAAAGAFGQGRHAMQMQAK